MKLFVNRWARMCLVLCALVLGEASGAASQPRAKFEPEEGCLIGAFIQNDPSLRAGLPRTDDVALFESKTRPHSSYLTYAGYGQPFPATTVAHYTRNGAIMQIGFEPNSGLGDVGDTPYLRDWARAAKSSGARIFLRWASEMNGPWVAWYGDPALYIDRWKTVARVMREEAPNVAMVWTPNDVPNNPNSPANNPFSYYPGDEYVDWVGVDFYSTFYTDSLWYTVRDWKDPRAKLSVIYDVYAARKPIMISEWGVAHDTNRGDTTGIFRYAASRIDTLYAHLKTEFPRVKAVTYFDYNTANAPNAYRDYKLTSDPGILAQYRRSVSDPYFLSPPINRVLDNADSGFSCAGKFRVSTSQADRWGADYMVCSTDDSLSLAIWRPVLPASGVYDVFALWSAWDNRSSGAPYVITHDAGRDTVRMNQKTGGGQWNLLGRWSFHAGASGSVELTNAAEPGCYVIADAVRFELVTGRTTSVDGHERTLPPTGFGLGQNFPNPFNPSTTFFYTLGAASSVRLSIYDAMGRERAVLVERVMPQGSHSARWDARNYPSGIYFCRLRAGAYSFTKAMVLLK